MIDDEEERLLHQWNAWLADGFQLAAPTLLHYEVVNALYQYAKHGILSTSAVEVAVAAAHSLPVKLFGDLTLHDQALSLTVEHALPATYAAHYLALASRLGADLWTADKKLVNALSSEYPSLSLWT